MKSSLLTFALAIILESAVSLKNQHGCLDPEGDLMAKNMPPECILMVAPGMQCKSSGQVNPFTLTAELGQRNTVTVSFGYDEYGEGTPISSIVLAAEDASKPHSKIGHFKDISEELLDVWCCNSQGDENMIALVKDFPSTEGLQFKWKPGRFVGNVAFFATITSGGECYKSIRSNTIRIQATDNAESSEEVQKHRSISGKIDAIPTNAESSLPDQDINSKDPDNISKNDGIAGGDPETFPTTEPGAV